MANRMWRVALPAALVGALLGGGGWMLASQGGAEAAPGKAAGRPAVGATRYDRVFNNVFYKVPAGYKAIQYEKGVVMVPQADLDAGETGRYFVITPGLQLNAAIKAKMRDDPEIAVQAIAIATGNLADDPDAKLSKSAPCNDPAKDGYACFVLSSVSKDKDAGGATRYAQYDIIVSGDHADIIMRVAYNSVEKFSALDSEFNDLLASIEPKNSGAPAPARLADALPTDLAAITPKPKPAPAQSASNGSTRAKSSGGRDCTVRYRQQIYFKQYGGISMLPVPYTPAGCQ